MKVAIPVGVDKAGNTLVGYAHPFFLGLRKNETRLPTTIKSRKAHVADRDGFRVVLAGVLDPQRPKTQAREIARRLRQGVKHAN